ncbi:Phage tail-collar fibre protein [Andreprevotia lacus DSM 23236]|jgi:phage-related tail fiber protein|uniref:Phage tail-collar fibre protein n=1 Tax=Andreprevotia lacus DSM 23236 TaxID=1121001 RepID=A0A1W1XL57_9NEIS|nr:phage tail protein [Andreprevotia lacus]SMC24238.1 Phage tail-collar fibre protein [Andreprevotia lacus DSM 23236]
MPDFYSLVTTTGKARLAAAIAAGQPLQLVQFAVGDGDNGASYNPDESQVALKHEVWRGQVNQVLVDPANPGRVIVEGLLPDSAGPFTVREVGIFSPAGELIAIGKYPSSYKPVFGAGANKQMYVRMVLAVTNTAAVSLTLDPSVVIASQTYVDQKVTTALNQLSAQLSAELYFFGQL